ncbi:MAG: winged helix-turn-helix transcriptional regulator [Chthoniobacterales bacterium]|nr:winged helix-turn-helix transcriptional regulator [Chthoniobacterales bacterium]
MKKNPKKITAPEPHAFTYLTNHSHVLVALDTDPELRVRDLASFVGITERAVQRILSDLEEAGAIKIERVGRRNRYRIQRGGRLRHSLEEHCTIGGLLSWVHSGARSRGGD